MPWQKQAEEEITGILSEMLDIGLSPMASISLADVRKLMVLSWVRGFTASREPPNCPTCED